MPHRAPTVDNTGGVEGRRSITQAGRLRRSGGVSKSCPPLRRFFVMTNGALPVKLTDSE